MNTGLLSKDELYEVIRNEGVEAFNHYRRATGYAPLDLSGLDFTGKDLTGINFSNANLASCTFDFAYLAEAQGNSEQTIDAAAKAIARFEEYTKWRDFKRFHIEQAKGAGNFITEVSMDETDTPQTPGDWS